MQRQSTSTTYCYSGAAFVEALRVQQVQNAQQVKQVIIQWVAQGPKDASVHTKGPMVQL